MKKGFTLLELIIVIIIVGILATLGFVQYSAVIEKARGTEARAVISTLRSQVAAKAMAGETGAYTGTALGVTTDLIPPACVKTNYFNYSVSNCSSSSCTFIATRCTGTSGKQPGATNAGTLQLVWYFGGTDTWSTTAGY
jgi:type IV pilus assembly protein PilE